MHYDTGPVRRAYEAVASEYTTKFIDELQTNEFDRAVIDEALTRLAPNAVLMDVGCGPGQVLAHLARSERRVLGLDLTPAMLGYARQQHPSLPLVAGDVLALPLGSQTCDGVIAWFSIHNMPRTELPRAFSELRRIMRSKGRLLIATHEGTDEDVVEQVWRGQPEQVVITYLGRDELKSLVIRHGFSVSEIRSRAPLSHERQATKLFVLARAT